MDSKAGQTFWLAKLFTIVVLCSCLFKIGQCMIWIRNYSIPWEYETAGGIYLSLGSGAVAIVYGYRNASTIHYVASLPGDQEYRRVISEFTFGETEGSSTTILPYSLQNKRLDGFLLAIEHYLPGNRIPLMTGRARFNLDCRPLQKMISALGSSLRSKLDGNAAIQLSFPRKLSPYHHQIMSIAIRRSGIPLFNRSLIWSGESKVAAECVFGLKLFEDWDSALVDHGRFTLVLDVDHGAIVADIMLIQGGYPQLVRSKIFQSKAVTKWSDLEDEIDKFTLPLKAEEWPLRLPTGFERPSHWRPVDEILLAGEDSNNLEVMRVLTSMFGFDMVNSSYQRLNERDNRWPRYASAVGMAVEAQFFRDRENLMRKIQEAEKGSLEDDGEDVRRIETLFETLESEEIYGDDGVDKGRKESHRAKMEL